MEFLDAAVWFVFSLSACVGGGLNALRYWSHARQLQDTPSSKVRSAAQGYVELSGVLQPSEKTLFGPLTEQPCLWWRYRIERQTTNGKKEVWRIEEKGCSEAWLRLADGTGECLIDPRGAEVFPATCQKWEGGLRHPLRKGSKKLSDRIAGRYRYTEERLHAGEELYAIGEFQTEIPVREPFDGEQTRRAVMREWEADVAGLLHRFDANGDGRLDDEEQVRIHEAAEVEAGRRHRKAALQPDWHRLFKPGENRPFILSSHGKDGTISELHGYALVGMVFCVGGASGLAWLADKLL
jgi:hypothetical protein